MREFASLPAVDVQRLAREERADFAAFLATLPPQQWQAPTLCARWRVREVVAHVIGYDDLDARRLLALAARGRFRTGRVNDLTLARYETASPEHLLALLTGHLQPRGLPTVLGGRVALAKRSSITMTSAAPSPATLDTPERLLPALCIALIAPEVGGFWRIRSLRLVATDLRFAAGTGPKGR